MKSVKILHCADIHFDTTFYDLSKNKAEQRKEDLRETFGKIVKLAEDEKVDLLLISGDLFDNASVMKTTIDYIIKKLQQIESIKVFISPGNHDPYFAKSFYNVIKWPKNVHIFKKPVEKIYIAELNACVYGVGFENNHENKSLFNGFSVENDELINIMVMHGEVTNATEENFYNPISIDDIEKSKLDYLALGHKHSFSGIKRNGKTFWAYSGNPEGRGFDELYEKGVLIGTVGKNFCDVKFKEICKRKYFEKNIDISGVCTYEEISEKILNQFENENIQENIYKIILEGNIKQNFNINISVIYEKIKEYFYFVKIIDKTTLEVDYKELMKEFSLKGIFVKKIMEKIDNASSDEEKEKFDKVLKLGVKALEEGRCLLE